VIREVTRQSFSEETKLSVLGLALCGQGKNYEFRQVREGE
jgi:hypothetical protein